MGRRADPQNRASKRGRAGRAPQGVLSFLLTDIEGSTPPRALARDDLPSDPSRAPHRGGGAARW